MKIDSDIAAISLVSIGAILAIVGGLLALANMIPGALTFVTLGLICVLTIFYLP